MVGYSEIESDQSLVTEFEQNPERPLKEWVPVLEQRIRETAPNRQVAKFQIELLAAIAKTARGDMPVLYIEPDTKSLPESTDVGNARGYFTMFDKGRIGIKSPEFAKSGLTTETLLHEMLHATVYAETSRLENIDLKDVKPEDLDAWYAVQELKALLTEAQAHIAKNEVLKERWGAATESIHELIAWGMTNPDFQEQVLSQISVETNVTTRVRKSGFKSMVYSLARLVGLIKGESINGLGIMIGNVSQIIDSVQKQPQEPNSAVTGDQTAQQQMTLRMEAASPMRYTTEQVFKALSRRATEARLSPLYREHLAGVMGQVVNAVYGPFGVLKPAAQRSAPLTTEDDYINALVTGQKPFASALSANLKMTDLEAWVLESAEVTVREGMNSSTLVQNEMRQIYAQAKAALKPEDFDEGVYALLFDPRATESGTTDFLSQFAAASLAYQPLYNKLHSLKMPVSTDVFSGKSFADRVKLFFSKLLGIVSRKVTKTYEGQTLNQAMVSLASSLARIEERRKANLEADPNRVLEFIDKTTNTAAGKVKKAVESTAQSRLFTHSRFATVRAVGKITDAVAGERSDAVLSVLFKVRDRASKERYGTMAEIINEMRDERASNRVFRKLLAKTGTHEQKVKRTIEDMANFVLESFDPNHKLTAKESQALTRIFVKLDMGSLIDPLNDNEIDMGQLLADPAILDAAIKRFEDKLTGPHLKFYVQASKALGKHLADGKVTSKSLLFNAHNIAALADTNRMSQAGSMQYRAAVEEILDPLITLYGIRYSDQKMVKTAYSVLQREEARTDDANGVALLVRMHRDIQQDSKRLFKDNPYSMQKGYIKEIYNPHITVAAGTRAEGEEYKKAGYKQVMQQEMGQDALDPTDAKFLYTVRDRGLKATVTGVFTAQSRKAKGSALDGSWLDAAALRKREADVDALFDVDLNWDPRQARDTYMAPIIGANGRAQKHRYLMTEQTKDNVLERDDRVDRVMGHLAGSVVNKGESPVINALAVDALRKDYTTGYLADPSAYLVFGPNSPDPVIQERYARLNTETRDYIRQVWGKNEMMVRKDLYLTLFGYRKFSLVEMFEKEASERGHLEHFLVTILENIPVYRDGRMQPMGRQAATMIARAENVWQEIVSVIKDIFVIKNLFTLIGNETSNMSVLWLSGVPIKDIIKNKGVATRSTMQYMEERRELDKLEKQIRYDYLTSDAVEEAQQRIIELVDSMNRNPVKVLVDGGLFQTLVEDLSVDPDPYSYKSRLIRSIDKKTDYINPRITKVGRFVAMTHDTTLYKFLNQATILSDFTARFVLYEHLTKSKKKGENGMNPDDAMSRVRRAFVNYDVPTHKGVQYLNDMGLLWFSKYYLRIQNVIVDLVKENPGRALTLLTMIDPLFNTSDILDSSMVNKSPGNWGTGPFQLWNALDEPITMHVLTEAVGLD
jgi:hypothetical protein